MNEIIAFAVTVIIISSSGVMSPGPLFAANVTYGLRQGVKAGLKMAYGHTLVEFPLILLLGLGVISLDKFPEFRVTISIIGAIALFAFAALQIKSIFKEKFQLKSESNHGPFLAGVLFTGLNPFFIIWWFTIGLKLITDSIALWSFVGLAIMFGFHIWMDYVWLMSVALVSKKGSGLLSNRNYKIFMVGISGLLIYFGITFFQDALY